MIRAYLNGRVQNLEEAQVPAMDAGLLLGAGLFETLRAYDRFIFRLGDHLDRLEASAEVLEIPIEETREELERAVGRVLRENALQDARLRMTITRGPLPGEDATGTSRPTCLVTAGRMTPYPDELYANGMTVTVSDVRANHTDPTVRHKTTGYMTNLLILRDAHSKGAHEAIRLNGPGRLAEGAISNVFLVADGSLVTPPVEEGCLPGIARKVVLELAEAEGIAAEQRPIEGPELLEADEVFLTNTIMEIMPVGRIERHPVGGDEPGEVTRRLMELYRDKVAEEREAADGV